MLRLSDAEKRGRLCVLCLSNLTKRTRKPVTHWIRYKNLPEDVKKEGIDPESYLCSSCYRNEYHKSDEYEYRRMADYINKREKQTIKDSYCTKAKCLVQRKIIVQPKDYYKHYKRCNYCGTPWPKENLRCGCCNHILRSKSKNGKWKEEKEGGIKRID